MYVTAEFQGEFKLDQAIVYVFRCDRTDGTTFFQCCSIHDEYNYSTLRQLKRYDSGFGWSFVGLGYIKGYLGYYNVFGWFAHHFKVLTSSVEQMS